MVVFSENAAHHCSVLTLLAIGFERYHAICHPLRENFSSRVSSHNILIPLVWILSCLATLPFALIYGTQSTEYIDGSMADQCSVKGISMKLYEAYIMFIFTVLFALPLVLLTIMYTAISLTIATSAIPSLEEKVTCKTSFTGSRQSRSQDKAQHNNSKAIAGRRQVVKMMVAVMFMYFICLLPLRCMQVWTLFASESDFIDLGQEGFLNLVNTSRILMYLNSATNPVIYGLLSSNFRAAFKQSFYTCKLRRQGRGKYNSAYYSRQHHHHYLYQQTQVTNSNASCSSADVRKEALNCRTSVGENNKLLHCLQKTSHGNNVLERRSLKLGDSPESECRTELFVQDGHGSGNGPVFV
ncbi:unnamed protein product [Lymnaea stagnalis]|uniref:G-protein coupled receptors family 1 profile domain-containing protein n=1 Tax=Lymnaea stagnalis TaxID=6523 RepID=A0AAV2HJ83_LYMST